jgi:hypothetical protein
MIVVKPKPGTIFSIMMFSLPLLALAIYGFYILKTDQPLWYHYLYMLGFGPISLGLIFRQIFGYRTITLGKDKLIISYLLKRGKIIHSLKQLKQWNETAIKTPSGNYKQVELIFETNYKVALSMQEHTEYHQVVKFLKKKHSKKMMK